MKTAGAAGQRGGSQTLLIFSFGCVSKLGKCERTSQLRTTCVCSSVPVTMLPTALRAAVCNSDAALAEGVAAWRGVAGGLGEGRSEGLGSNKPEL